MEVLGVGSNLGLDAPLLNPAHPLQIRRLGELGHRHLRELVPCLLQDSSAMF